MIFTKHIIALVCWLLFTVSGMAQNRITGTVTDATSKQPIAGANIFISNTSKGTTSDARGIFALQDVPDGKYDLVVSITGYETIVHSFNSSQLPLRLDVQMQVKMKQWETVDVRPFEKDGWEKWGKLFTDAFLGQSANAAACTILNKNAIRFRHDKKTNTLEAVADTLLLIENKALGYRVRYQLEAFEYNFQNRSVIYGGYPLFEEMDTARKAKQRRYAKARRTAFYGSTMHFIRALYYNQLAEQGFDVRTLQQIPNEEKARVKKIYGIKSVGTTGRTQIIYGGRNNLPGDSSDYYQMIMKQPDFFEIIGQNLLTADSLATPGDAPGYKVFSFPYQLLVIYKNEKPAPEYQRMQWGRADPQQTTRMFFVDEQVSQLHIYPNGSYYDPLTLFLNGYMGWEKIAELLPLEYQPD